MERAFERAFQRAHTTVNAHIPKHPDDAAADAAAGEEERLRVARGPITAADAVPRIALAFRDRDYFRRAAVLRVLGGRVWVSRPAVVVVVVAVVGGVRARVGGCSALATRVSSLRRKRAGGRCC